MYPTEEIKKLNRMLAGKYGEDLTGRAKFRLSRAGDNLERRKALYRDFDNNKIFIREVEEVREVKKYEHLDDDCIILERLNEGEPPPDVAPSSYSKYELLYAFKKKDGSNQTEMAWRAIEFLVEMVVRKWDRNYIWKTAKDFIKEYQEQKTKEAELFFEILDNENPYQATMLHNQEAIVVPDMSKVTPDPFGGKGSNT